MGARLFRFRTAWEGAHHESVIKKGLSWSWEKGGPPPPKIIDQETTPDQDRQLVKMRRKRVIEKAKEVRHQSRIFSIPKKDNPEDRMILDLSFLNSCIKCPTFKMLTIREVKLLLPRYYWTVSIDFKEGFWHVPISPSKRPFLGFRWKGQNWQFRAMPFGLNVAPRIFTKIVAHVIRLMSEEGIWCLPYLDDLLIIAATKEECIQKTERALEILKSLGWILNTEKSRLTPSQKFEWLGVYFDLTSHTARTPVEKMNQLQQLLRQLIVSEFSTVREIMKVQGIANWVSQHDPIVKLMLPKTRKILRYFKGLGLDTPVVLGSHMKLGLCRWSSGTPIPQNLGAPKPNIIIQTDATLEGWGFQIDSKRFWGIFDGTMSYSINVLELLTVWYSLLMIEKKGVVIQIRCDNSAAIAAVRRSASLVHHLSALAELIWRRAVSYQWILYISHIQGSFNVIADQLSRRVEISTEWSLSPRDFQRILSWNPELQVDLFATSLNNQLPTFISPCPDEKAAAIDALSTPWDRWEHLYIFPPTNLISKVLAKMTQSSLKSATLVTPETPTRPWYMALELLKAPSRLIEVHLQQIVVDKLVVNPRTTKLRVWKLSKHHTKRGFQTA